MDIAETKDVWLVTSNTDLTEGRGKKTRVAYCETYATAVRIGKGKCVQGGNCPIEKCTLVRLKNKSDWYGPVTVSEPTKDDLENQLITDERDAAVTRAIALGLTEDELRRIKT